MGNRHQTEKLVLIALLVALSVVLGIVDRTISVGIVPVPGVKLGLANIIILTALYYLKFSDSLLLIILKTVLTGLILGNFTAFVIGTFGSIISFIIMILLVKFTRDKVSVIGISLAGAMAHTLGQVMGLIITQFYIDTIVFSLIYMIPLSAVTGFFVGIVVTSLRKYLDKGLVFKSIFKSQNDETNLDAMIEDDQHIQ